MKPSMIDLDRLKQDYPAIEVAELFPAFPRLPVPEQLALAGYSWEDCHRGFIGSGGLWLVAEVAQQLGLGPDSRVLDLCCGNASSSIFLARHFGVQVVALDREVSPTATWQRVKAAGLTGQVTPVQMDARDLRFPEEHFDAVFCLNSYFYFGTDAHYLPYLLRFVRPGGRLGIASPCYRRELTPDVPPELLYDAPDYQESASVHSPGWWRSHLERTGQVNLRVCDEHPQGRELWLDDIRWLLEECHPRNRDVDLQSMVLQSIIMLLSDRERLVTYLTIVAEKRS